MGYPVDPNNAPARLGKLIDQLVAACPDAAILVAELTPGADPVIQARIATFNAAIPSIVQARVSAGKHVMAVNMSSAITTADISPDGEHPSDEGYKKMADVWLAGLEQVNTMGWITEPVTAPSASASVGKSAPTGTATSSVSNKGTKAGKAGSGGTGCLRNVIWFKEGQIDNGDKLGANMWPGFVCTDQYISPSPTPPNTMKSTNQTQNSSQNSCTCTPDNGHSYIEPLSGPSCADMSTPQASAVHFADLTGSGRADYLWVSTNGSVHAFYNQGGPKGGDDAVQVSWQDQGIITPGSVVCAYRSQIQFADLDGDGRAEYLLVHPNGSVEAWLNQGSKDSANPAKISWLYQGLIFAGIGENGAGTRFADLDGSGKADYIFVAANGSLTALANTGPKDPQNPARVSFAPFTVLAPDAVATRDEIVFADINGDGRADLLVVSRSNGSVQEWANQIDGSDVGWAGMGLVASGVGDSGLGVQFADLDGDGRADYLDVDPGTSAVSGWMNGCGD